MPAIASQIGLQPDCKLLKINPCIAIQVVPPQNPVYDFVRRKTTLSPQKLSDIFLIKPAILPIVYVMESAFHIEIILVFQISLHLVDFQLKTDFLE